MSFLKILFLWTTCYRKGFHENMQPGIICTHFSKHDLDTSRLLIKADHLGKKPLQHFILQYEMIILQFNSMLCPFNFFYINVPVRSFCLSSSLSFFLLLFTTVKSVPAYR